MSLVRFRLPSSHVVAAVEIYDSDLALRIRTLSSEGVELDPGHYHVVARLPAGTRLTASINVLPDQLNDVRLGAKPESLAEPLAPRSPGTGTATARKQRAGGHSPSYDKEPRRIARGKWSDGEWQLWRSPERRLPLLYRSSLIAPSVELRLTREPAVPQWSVVPTSALRYLRPAAAADAGGPPRLTSRLRDRAADAVMAYVNRGQVLDAALMAQGVARQAENLLGGKKGDPVAAAAGAFALLTLGELDRLHDWTANLHNWFDWLPDGAVVYAEHMALIGDHEQAAHTLRQLAIRGLPCLTVALTTAVNRLSIYVAADLGGDELRAVSERLTRYVIACDLMATVTSFTAYKAAEPLPRAPSHRGRPTIE
jgi:hypothetical protein